MRPIILDTDVGTDVDDAFAIVQAARSPELDLKAITTVYGDVHLRGRMAHKMLDLLGLEHVPVAAGLAQPLTPGLTPYWGGWEGEKLLTPADQALSLDRRDAVTLIQEILVQSSEPVTLIAIGPLTNIAALILAGRHLDQIDEIICMAGTTVPGDEEWNVQCDPEAARVVFQSGLPVRLGTRFFVNQPKLTPIHRDRLASSTDPAVMALVAMLDHFLSRKKRDITPMYDPVTLSMAYTDRYLQAELVRLNVSLQAGVLLMTPDPDGEHALQLSVRVRPEAFVDHLVDRLLDAA